MKRDIIKIDEDKCTGCGICVEGCHEGALQIIDGKARLVNEIFCDGLGACINDCPEDAITIERKEAEPYDETVTIERLLAKSDNTVIAHLLHLYHYDAKDFYKEGVEYLKNQKRFDLITKIGEEIEKSEKKSPAVTIAHAHSHAGGGCPGSASQSFAPPKSPAPTHSGHSDNISELTHWPVQLHLVSPSAGFFKAPELVVMSTCGPIASANVHRDYLSGRPVVIACPKLDRTDPYREKLAAIINEGGMRKLIVVRMEVPCCGGLTQIVKDARELSGRDDLIIEEHTLSLQGELIAMNRK